MMNSAGVGTSASIAAIADAFVQAVKSCMGDGEVFECAVVPTAAIVFAPELLKACESNTCGTYNKCWTCPPAVGTPEKQKEKITAFSSAFVFSTVGKLEDSFDYEGMMRAQTRHNRLTVELHGQFGKTNPVFGAGACTLCSPCAYPQPCRFPDKTYLSLEAAGINVTELSRAGGMKYHNGENTVTYFGMVLF